MNRDLVTKLANELATLIERLIELQVSLQAVVREKLGAMRRADTEAMLSASHREENTASSAVALDGKRLELVSKLSRAVGLSGDEAAEGVTLRMLAGRLEPALQERFLKLADRLRQEMVKLSEANQVVELVSREMLTHFKSMFSAMLQEDDAAPTYSSRGEMGPAAGARVLDAVG
jgi:phage gp29-like protein